MSGFNTKERNNNGEYEITFYTESRQDFEKVQDLCRELIGHNKPVSIKGDLISREYVESIVRAEVVDLQDGTEEWRTYVNDTCENILIKVHNAPTVTPDKIQAIMSDYLVYRCEPQRPQGEWIELPKAFDSRELPCKCSRCGHILSFMNHYPKSNFCPNCGADMRGKEE